VPLKRALQSISAFACLLISIAPTRGQTYPDRPVKIVLGARPGGGVDVLVVRFNQFEIVWTL
jgi:tripartite-type tricarboxylate transporter receptor subunit TctC